MISAVKPIVPEPDSIHVEVAFVDDGRQFLRALDLPAGSCVADAIRESGVVIECGLDFEALDVGVWSKPVPVHSQLNEGDRVEIYRPLQVDPKQARRARIKRRS